MDGDQGMVTTGQQAPGRATVAQRWLARLALVAAAAAVLVAPVVAGLRQSLALVLVGLVGLALTMAGVWWALTNKGLVRGLAVALAVAAPLTVLVLYTRARLTWVVLVALGLLALAVAAGRAALRRDAIPERMQEYDVAPPRRPFLIMNPRSGGGKVTRFGLKDKAEALGATVALLEGPQVVDVGELARRAVADGADLLGVAGGDGTQALVAGIAAEHGVPLLVISAGTRNHFALDLGLDRDDPSRCLDALHDGVELLVDLGFIGERPFVNNASFGAYAAVVQSPAYRDDKTRTTLDHVRRHRRQRGPGGRPCPRDTIPRAHQAGRTRGRDRRRRMPRSRSGSTVRRCCWTPPCAARSGRPPSGSGYPATVPGCRIPSPSWTGSACGRWP